MAEKKRLEWLDVLKGMGMCIVISLHGIIPSTVLQVLFNNFVMPLFFFVSGYTFKQRENKILIKNKIERMLIPYFLTDLLVIFLSVLRNLYNGWDWGNIFSGIKIGLFGGLYGMSDGELQSGVTVN